MTTNISYLNFVDPITEQDWCRHTFTKIKCRGVLSINEETRKVSWDVSNPDNDTDPWFYFWATYITNTKGFIDYDLASNGEQYLWLQGEGLDYAHVSPEPRPAKLTIVNRKELLSTADQVLIKATMKHFCIKAAMFEVS